MKALTLVFLRRGDEILLGYKKRGFGAGEFDKGRFIGAAWADQSDNGVHTC